MPLNQPKPFSMGGVDISNRRILRPKSTKTTVQATVKPPVTLLASMPLPTWTDDDVSPPPTKFRCIEIVDDENFVAAEIIELEIFDVANCNDIICNQHYQNAEFQPEIAEISPQKAEFSNIYFDSPGITGKSLKIPNLANLFPEKVKKRRKVGMVKIFKIFKIFSFDPPNFTPPLQTMDIPPDKFKSNNYNTIPPDKYN
jgi:hypothetical protein